MFDSAAIYELIEARRKELGLSQAEVSQLAFGRSDSSALQNIRRGASPSVKKLSALGDVLGLEFYFGPARKERPKNTFDGSTMLPHHGIAKCSIQGWGKDQPELRPLPRAVFVDDPAAFYVSAQGQSMIPEGINGGNYCLVSPAKVVEAGDRIWLKDADGATSIKRLLRKDGNSLMLRGWMPRRDGQQSSFEEERFIHFVAAAHPVVAVYEGKPGTEGVQYVPDPRDAALTTDEPFDCAEFEFIPLHDVQAAAGLGRANTQDAAISGLAFPSQWLRDQGVNGKHASLIYVSGDSMAPTLEDGATIMINLNHTRPTHRRIYAFRVGDELRVKRLELLDEDRLLILSDNPAHSSELVTLNDADDIEIIGEVVWASKTV